ncbi:hypothetical protein ACJIZ3_011745 [Penstemon smallii]|uniref:Uncharacterized protein n=1 Tax=Penstemon smallii TaxID=265156 RepID=A0ABD3UMW1_9LAMI
MAQKDYGALRYIPPHARISPDDNSKKENYGIGMQKGRKQGIRTPQAAEPKPPLAAASKPLKNQYNRASGGPGMQAIFLGSNPKSCGTGVFIPRTEGIDFHLGNNNIKPVLLPSRVVQTLNLNVQDIGQQIKPQTAQPINNADEDFEKNKKPDNDMYSSPEIIILPEEWTYDVL